MVAQVSHQGPEAGDPAYFVQKHHVAQTVGRLQLIGVVSVEENPVYPPLVALSFALLGLALSQQVIEGIVERFVWAVDDGSPVGYDCQSKGKVALNCILDTVGISTSNSPDPWPLLSSMNLEPKI